MKILRFNLIEDLIAGMLEMQLPEINEADNGIGSYDYWGATGIDIQLDGEVEELEDIKFEYHIPKNYIYLTSENFSNFISENVSEVDDAVAKLESMAREKHRATLNDENYRGSKTDYSDIIKLLYTIRIETRPCSVEVYKLTFTFTWIDARSY